MGNIKYVKSSAEDIEVLVKIRMEMLRVVNNLPDDYEFDEQFVAKSRRYFECGNQTSVLAYDNEIPVGCASISYIWIMPTFDHPTGKRAHLMNVYTRAEYRRCGISRRMIEILIEEAKEKGVTEISLDTTQMGRALYEAVGFEASSAGMVMTL